MKHIAIKVSDDVDYESMVEQIKKIPGVMSVYVERQYYSFDEARYIQREDIELKELNDN